MWNRIVLQLSTLLAVAGVFACLSPAGAQAVEKPNIVIVFTDDESQ
ncbi:MAG: hypothetical protein IH899_21815 [Planctomycetes bacterium]|nr:hypothetical protein [Planctomycetota bacterium]